MRILVINPNSTETMTQGIVAVAKAAAAPDVQIVGMTNHSGPPAIQGAADGDVATVGVVEAAEQAEEHGFDAFIIACFDDTGLDAARTATKIPVIGIGQAAFHTAMLFGGRFSVVTTLAVSVPVIEENIARYQLNAACADVRASGLPVLSLEDDPETAASTLRACANDVARSGDASSIVLGCAGMAAFADDMQTSSGLPAIDGVAAAVGLARTAIWAIPKNAQMTGEVPNETV